MTQINVSKERRKSAGNNKEQPHKCGTQFIWMLVIIGACILTIIYCLTIASDTHEVNVENSRSVKRSILEEFLKYINEILAVAAETNLVGCHENLCKIDCIATEDLPTNLYKTIEESSCNFTDILRIEYQQLPLQTLKNFEINIKHPIYEVVIASSNISVIENGAFSSPLFADTTRLTWYKLNTHRVESGSLLGLHSLQYLSVDSSIDKLGETFIHPVQATLTNLTLNAGLIFSSNESLFGTSDLQKLKYLDLSRNFFSGPLEKAMFSSTPNLEHLVIQNSNLSSIEDDAFVNLAGKLYILNLSENLLTAISPSVFEPLLLANRRSSLQLDFNNWVCDCQIPPMVEFYREHRSEFMNALYCNAPLYLHGTSFDELDFLKLRCTDDSPEMTVDDLSRRVPNFNPVPSFPQIESHHDMMFEMRCINLNSTDSETQTPPFSNQISSIISTEDSNSSSGSLLNAPLGDKQVILEKEIISIDDLEYIHFEPPDHEFEIHLFDNRSAQIIIADFHPNTPINIIWFSDEMEDFNVSHVGETIDYNCDSYAEPYLLVEDLVPNTTYTFCLIPHLEVTITPFNCLPLYVPPAEDDQDIWISEEEKQLTIGILCLLFTMSTLFGAGMAYLGIRKYPYLIEGSKNVLVVKKSDRNCYVSTISKNEHLQNSSIQKSAKVEVKRKDSVIMNSSPTSIEGCFTITSASNSPQNGYEMPKYYERSHDCTEYCISKDYALSPPSPPPLPRRNSHL